MVESLRRRNEREICFFGAAGRKDAESGSVAGVDQSFSATPGAGGNSDAVEPSVTEGANPGNEVASSQQQQTCHLQRSPVTPSAPALPRPCSAWLGHLQVEQDRPIPADSASCEAEQAPAPEDTTCGKPDGEISRASLPGVEAQRPAQAVFLGPLHRGWKKAEIERAHRAVTREAKATAMTKLGRLWSSPSLVGGGM